MNDVLQSLTKIFKEVFDDESLEIARKTTAADVEGWDSLMQIRLVIATEKHYQIKFSTQEWETLENIGQFIDLVETKIK